jgi:predicted Zn-dependent protease
MAASTAGIAFYCHHKLKYMQNRPQAHIYTAQTAIIFIVAGMLLCSAPRGLAQTNLPQLGDNEAMSIAAERKLGQSIARDIYRDPDYVNDPLIQAYVERIWQPLMQASRAQGNLTPEMSERFAFEVVLARDRTINAFALPGGYMGVHLGLIAMVGTRDELASVLAHELSHMTQRHIARMLTKQKQQSPLLLGAMILGALAAGSNVEVGNAVIVGAQAAGVASKLSFSRDMEREADRVGYQVLQDAHFNVQGFVGMFDKLALANRINDNGSYPYLRTHPLTSERIGDMQARLQLDAAPAAPADEAMQLEHALMAVRARLLADPAPDLLRAELQRAQNTARVLRAQRGSVAAQVPSAAASAGNAANANASNLTGGKTAGRAPGPASVASTTASQSTNATINQIAQIYGGAVAALKLRDNAAALSLAQTALDATQVMRLSPTVQSQYAQLAIDSALSEAALATGDAQRARQVMQPYVQGSRSDRAAVLQWVATLRAPGTPAAELTRASEQLQSWVAQNPSDAGMWEALASVYEAQNQPLRAIRASAEARVALLDYSAALDRFKAGQALARQTPGSDHIELSILDTRARAVQALVRGQQRDDKED